ncbi:unnamed protein product [Chrysoparadoxa australica]
MVREAWLEMVEGEEDREAVRTKSEAEVVEEVRRKSAVEEDCIRAYARATSKVAGELKAALHRARALVDRGDKAADVATGSGVSVEDIVAYAQRISGTTNAPAYWQPGMPMVGFRPPNPTPEMMRMGKLMKIHMGKEGEEDWEKEEEEEGEEEKEEAEDVEARKASEKAKRMKAASATGLTHSLNWRLNHSLLLTTPPCMPVTVNQMPPLEPNGRGHLQRR